MLKKSFHTPIGTLTLVSHFGELIYCNWDEAACNRKLHKIESLVGNSDDELYDGILIKDREVIENTCKQLNEYFAGSLKKFDLPIKLIGSDFQKSVWKEMNEIPFGKTCSYTEIAVKIDKPKAFRAVAGACGANPIAIILPCHRVSGSHGKLGGYTGGTDKKQWLLEHEAKTSGKILTFQ